MSFSGPVRVQWHSNGTDMILLEAVTYTDPAGRDWHAPFGFTTNGASIPNLFQGAVNVGTSFTSLARTAALFHDAAYSTPGVTKADADHMFKACMTECGCPQAQIDALFDAVHLFGSSAYAAAQREAACQQTET